MTHRPRRWKTPALAGVATVLLGWLAIVAGVVIAGDRDAARPADAIVVLGAAQYVGRPSPVLRARLDHALVLWRRGLAPQFVVTGGRGVGDTTSEAEVSRRYVMRRGVPDSAIVLENDGRTTSESMRAVATFMASRPSKKVILVSDPFHMLRLSLLARRFGLEPYTSPTRTSPIATRPEQTWKYVLGESLKVPLAFISERKLP